MTVKTDLFCSVGLRVEFLRLWRSLHRRRGPVNGLRLPAFLKGNPIVLHEQAQVGGKRQRRHEAERHSTFLQTRVAVVWSKNDGGDQEQQSDDTSVEKVQDRPAGDADPRVQVGGEEDEEQQGEEEGRAADELEEVERGAAPAAVDHFLLDEGHEGEEHFQDFDQEPDFIQMFWWNHETGGFRVRSRRRGVNFSRCHDGAFSFFFLFAGK